ncbi:hypothetical protein GLYMA_05G109851v4 [Glycine max]|nr:hypothetical protein GLYMA_05G109851v4 [Glycine max]KAH1133829.1 hypothetical protein GYH30_012291 [Glycine max]
MLRFNFLFLVLYSSMFRILAKKKKVHQFVHLCLLLGNSIFF